MHSSMTGRAKVCANLTQLESLEKNDLGKKTPPPGWPVDIFSIDDCRSRAQFTAGGATSEL